MFGVNKNEEFLNKRIITEDQQAKRNNNNNNNNDDDDTHNSTKHSNKFYTAMNRKSGKISAENKLRKKKKN